jgi:glucose/arabinose dehydrogenase
MLFSNNTNSKRTFFLLGCLLSYIIISSSVIIADNQRDVLVFAQSIGQQQEGEQEQEQERQPTNISNSGNETKTHIYGCGEYGDAFHCDPLLTELASYRMIGRSSKVFPIVNENPIFTNISNDTKNSTAISAASSPQLQGLNNALELLDKNREFVEISNIDAYNSDHFSVSFWIKKIADTSPRGHVVSHTNRDTIAGWYFDVTTESDEAPSSSGDSMDNQTLSFSISSNSSGEFKTKRLPISESSPTHITATFDGRMAKLYQNGRLFDSVQYNGTFISDPKLPIHIGSAAYCSSCNRWSGQINDLRLYNNTLSDIEIREISASASLSSSDSAPTLVGHWPLDADLNDVSSYNNDGVMQTPLGSMVFAPDGKLFYTEKNTGEIKIVKDNITLPKPFATIQDVYVSWEQGLLGITLDPDFLRNRFVYAYYTVSDNSSGLPFNRVVRFTDNNNIGTNMVVILDNIPASDGFHAGGALAFGPDQKLYITIGDATEHEYAQDPSIPIGKVLRINRDGSIPPDNPLPGSPVYTLGHRNNYGIAFDPSRNIGFLTENGDQLYDEINIIKKGGNYGFPLYQPPNIAPELSNDSQSLKPVRSYYNTIAPTQAIYYTGDKLPFLNGKFLFGTYTGNIYAMVIQSNGTREQVSEEEHIRLRLIPFEPVIGLAQSPQGDLYFGGYNIYKLDSLEIADRRQDLFPISVTLPAGISLRDLQASNDADYAFANLNADNITSQSGSSPRISIKVPIELIPEVFAVTSTAVNEDRLTQKSQLDFTIDNLDPSYNTLDIGLPANIKDLQLYINGTDPNPAPTDSDLEDELPLDSTEVGSINLYDNFESGDYVLADGQVSPNNKWVNIYNGGGSSGVKKDSTNNTNNVFYMYPNVSKSDIETFSNLVATPRNFSNFQMSLDVMTEKQTRENSPPKQWEAAWILFRYTDDFHYYWFVVKPSGIELGKKDCDTCLEPFQGQVFLYTSEEPTLELGDWSNWQINVIGNEIRIAVNGTEVVDFTDTSMSPQLASGSIGLYDEDALVAFDNVRIREIPSQR